MEPIAKGLRQLQNNKALKHKYSNSSALVRLRQLQNNKALKRTMYGEYDIECLRQLQNNKALKPQIKDKNARRHVVVL